MSEFACPKCGGELEFAADSSARCERCGIDFPPIGGLAKLSLGADAAPDPPDPIDAAKLASIVDELDRGAPFKASLEKLLLALDDGEAEMLMLVLREGRGAWHVLSKISAGRALFVGSAFSGAIIPLASSGFEVTVLDRSSLRARFGAHRDRALAPGRTRSIVFRAGDDSPRAPFRDASFDLVVVDRAPNIALGELRRICRGELVLVADNRLGYKRSSGRRGDFRVPNPLEWARDVANPRDAERTLGGHRRALALGGFERPRAFALYPHSREFSHVVALDAPLPSLTIGPKERQNLIKIAAHRVGLFPIFTPSFALFAATKTLARSKPRIDDVLDELAAKLGEPRPELEQLIATRGNTAVLLTRPAHPNSDDPRGRWCLHVPLSPQQRAQIVRHHAVLARLTNEFPTVPAPQALFQGAIGGLFLTCERRLGGLTAPQLTGDLDAAAAMFADCAKLLAELVVRPAAPFERADFERLVRAKCELVASFAGVASASAAIRELANELERSLVGARLPLVLYHADLRSKHVQVDERGRVLGVLDWGSSEDCDLPLFDLLHLIVHERKQEAGLSAARAWRIALDRSELRDHERAALDGYCAKLGIDDGARRAIERLYPILVGAMAEKNWDYSRPRWVYRQFAIG